DVGCEWNTVMLKVRPQFHPLLAYSLLKVYFMGESLVARLFHIVNVLCLFKEDRPHYSLSSFPMIMSWLQLHLCSDGTTSLLLKLVFDLIDAVWEFRASDLFRALKEADDRTLDALDGIARSRTTSNPDNR
ncbi:MAG: hypothetical protein SGPRY_014870, partial [Prymnesium sp.]